jgi:hypothetical protein
VIEFIPAFGVWDFDLLLVAKKNLPGRFKRQNRARHNI